jgi:hypothetical protein
MKTDVNLPLKSNKQKNFGKRTYFLLASYQPLTKKAGSVPICHGSTTLFGSVTHYRLLAQRRSIRGKQCCGSESGSGSGSGSFYHQAKKVRKTLIPTAL